MGLVSAVTLYRWETEAQKAEMIVKAYTATQRKIWDQNPGWGFFCRSLFCCCCFDSLQSAHLLQIMLLGKINTISLKELKSSQEIGYWHYVFFYFSISHSHYCNCPLVCLYHRTVNSSKTKSVSASLCTTNIQHGV